MIKVNFGTAFLVVFLVAACSGNGGSSASVTKPVAFGDRPATLANLLVDSPLKSQLIECDVTGSMPSSLVIGHRGAPLEIAEHTSESYIAAANQGAGIIECDVTFTKDRELVCRHSQCDLHTTTDILNTELAESCRVPPDLDSATPYANTQCCTSDITLAEYQSLQGKRDGGNKNAANLAEYFAATPGWVEGAQSNFGELLSHKESIALFDSLGVAMMPELKRPRVTMPFEGDYSQSIYAAQFLNDYIEAGIDPARVFPQSFNLGDIEFWLQSAPEFANQAVYLDGRYSDDAFDISVAATWTPSMEQLAADGVRYLASPLWMLLALDAQQRIVASDYSVAAKAAGLNIIAWTVERAGPITSGNNWYYQSIQSAIESEGDVFTVIDVLAKEVGVVGIFSDWPATTSYYTHCVN